jgi:hypothetical protein
VCVRADTPATLQSNVRSISWQYIPQDKSAPVTVDALQVLGLRQTQEWQSPSYYPRPKPYKWQRTPWQHSASLQGVSIPVVLMGGAEQMHPELDAGDELRLAYMPFAFGKQEYGPNCNDSSSDDDNSEEEEEW